ncbi:MAG: ABC transporter ATP-binding protein [Polyangia bacterium]
MTESEHAVEVTDLRKHYGPIRAVDGVSFTIKRGSIFGLVGPNGAGKTTTVEMIEGLRRPDRGSVRVLGLDPVSQRRRLYSKVGVQLQDGSLARNIKVGEALHLFASFFPEPLAEAELLARCGLQGREGDLYARLSGGQKRRLLLALALVGRPELLLLDEPTSGLDPQARFNLWQMLSELSAQGLTIFLTTHYMDEAEEYCDVLCIMDHGKILAMGTPKELLLRHGLQWCIKVRSLPEDLQRSVQSLQVGWPGLSKVEQVERSTLIFGAGEHFPETVRQGLVVLGAAVDSVESRPARIDDLYLLLTGRAYRKD